MKLGSLFSGSGSFELSGALFGIGPVWSSEIDPFCLRVESARFPNCKQLGSVKDINGANIEPVDVITFGSPCQDLSLAGKQAGIHEGARSSLFFEAIRIIQEMRNATANQFPRFAVWENVLGCQSSHKGADFRAVIEALVHVADPTASIPMPDKGKWLAAGCVVGEGYSLAWNIYDAQYSGVPQRRKRVYLITDYRSERAGEILFKPSRLRWDSEEGRQAEQRASAYIAGSPGGGRWFRWWQDTAKPDAAERERERVTAVWDARGNGNGMISPTLTGDHQNRVTDYTAIITQTR